MKAVKNSGWRAAVVVTAIASATVIALAVPAGAHEAEGPPDVDCNTASLELKDFPNGPSEITFHITVNGTTREKTTHCRASRAR
jgi:anti-sigma-K factor RskA